MKACIKMSAKEYIKDCLLVKLCNDKKSFKTEPFIRYFGQERFVPIDDILRYDPDEVPKHLINKMKIFIWINCVFKTSPGTIYEVKFAYRAKIVEVRVEIVSEILTKTIPKSVDKLKQHHMGSTAKRSTAQETPVPTKKSKNLKIDFSTSSSESDSEVNSTANKNRLNKRNLSVKVHQLTDVDDILSPGLAEVTIDNQRSKGLNRYPLKSRV